MLKLLIVEDEKWEREGLLDFIDWTKFGFDTVETACDGIEGLEKAEKLRPDIIITDIKMPGMDGLKMSKKIKSFLPGVKVIILTGYDDFRFAKEAIDFNANAYILKPFDEGDILPVLEKVVNDYKSEMEKENLVKSTLHESLQNSRTRFITDLLNGRMTHDELSNLLSHHHIEIPDNAEYVIAVIKVQETDCHLKDTQPSAGTDDNIKKSIDTLEALLGNEENALAHHILFSLPDSHEGQITLCFPILPDQYAHLLSCIKDVSQRIATLTNSCVNIGLGRPVTLIGNVGDSYKEALHAVKFGVFWGACGMVEYFEVGKVQREFSENAGEFLMLCSYFSKQLLHAVRFADEDRLFGILEEMFQHIQKNKGVSKELIINYLQNVKNETTTFLYTLGKDFSQPVMDRENMETDLLHCPNIQSLEESIGAFFRNALKKMYDKNKDKDIQIIKKVTRLIEKRYMSDISLKIIAKDVYLSPNYLGNLFKKCTGKTFNDYLCEYRMEKAKELLKSPRNKVNQVAANVGIPNTSYFCTVFKETYGIAPGEYQETLLRNR